MNVSPDLVVKMVVSSKTSENRVDCVFDERMSCDWAGSTGIRIIRVVKGLEARVNSTSTSGKYIARSTKIVCTAVAS